MKKTKSIKNKIYRNWNAKHRKPSKKLRKLQVCLALIIICLISHGVAFLEYQKLANDPWVWVRAFPSSWGDGEKPEKSGSAIEPVDTAEARPLVKESIGSIEEKIKEAFGEDWKEAYAVMMAESGGRPEAIGDGHLTYEYKGETIGMSCGLFQIRTLPGRPTCQEMLDPEKNIAFAKDLFERSGWQPWSAYKNGKYLAYMK